MTGYGKGRVAINGLTLTVEIKSVNHRYSDLNIKGPRTLLSLEGEIRKQVASRLKRGKIDVFVNVEFNGDAAVIPVMNQPLAAAYIDLFEKMRGAFQLEGGISLELLIAQKDIVTLKERENVEEEVRGCLDQAMNQALDAVEQMRLSEGEATRKEIDERLSGVEKVLARIGERAPQVPEEWRVRLTERLERLAVDHPGDPQRVAQEIAIFSDRCDITEETVRFQSHLDQFRKLLAIDEPVGRQMDFLVQELNRETNTMGSKSNDLELTRLVVGIKAELEKIREQVQNIE